MTSVFLRLSGRLMLAVCLTIVPILCAEARAQAAQERPAPAANASAPRESGGKAGGDGIKVHGHWTIDVRNADGTLASHNEFENALLPGGGRALSVLLAGAAQVGIWKIQLSGLANDGPCRYLSNPVPCIIDNGTYFVTYDLREQVFQTLQVAAPQDASGQYFGTFEITGHFTAAFPVEIRAVGSSVTSTMGSYFSFSARSFQTSGVQVAVGQIVYVRVTFSFS